MDRLVRNSNRIITPADGKPFKENDPEEYIKRLHHFASGMGFSPEHLTSGANPAFTGKEVNVTWFDNPKSRLRGIEHASTEYGFDEGLIPFGQAFAAQGSIDKVADNPDDALYASKELRHRGQMAIQRTSYYDRDNPMFSHHDMTASKEANVPVSSENPGEGKIYPISAGGGYESLDELHSKANLNMDFVADTFRERNRSRIVNPKGLDIVRHVLANPSDKNMAEIYRDIPSHISPQFLRVKTGDGGSRPKFDEIDLKTGTWAKIDPDGYFPT